MPLQMMVRSFSISRFFSNFTVTQSVEIHFLSRKKVDESKQSKALTSHTHSRLYACNWMQRDTVLLFVSHQRRPTIRPFCSDAFRDQKNNFPFLI